jgi:hypothetical protein
MNFLKKLGCAAAVTLAMAGTASASPVLNNWVFNPAGTGFASGVEINEYLDITGNAFIQLSAGGSPGTFSFKEHAVFNVPYGDAGATGFFSNPGRPTGNITATFEAVGTGTFSGAFTFTGGTIKMYQNNTFEFGSTNGIYGSDLGNLIAEFEVLPGGGGLVDASGSPINNGQVSVFARADVGDMDPGYFFRSNGSDLAAESILSFAFTNANTVGAPTNRLVSEVACQFAGFAGPGCPPVGGAYANAPGQYFFVSNNGQFKLAEVPEPGSLTLFGIAMLGAGVISRRRAGKKA